LGRHIEREKIDAHRQLPSRSDFQTGPDAVRQPCKSLFSRDGAARASRNCRARGKPSSFRVPIDCDQKLHLKAFVPSIVLIFAAVSHTRFLPTFERIWPSVVWGSLPSERLWRFNAPTQSQCGHGDCLSDKVGFSTPVHRAQNAKADGTSRLPARREPESSSFLRPSRRRNSVQKGLRKDGTALRHLTRKSIGNH
jgi:hypothetical protein